LGHEYVFQEFSGILARQNITVPRDPDVETSETSRAERMPSPNDVNALDEFASGGDKPLSSDSKAAADLHNNPRRAKGELGVGSAGDAARPSKEGITGKPIPPRGGL